MKISALMKNRPVLVSVILGLTALILFAAVAFGDGEAEANGSMTEQERRLASMLSSMEDVGRVELMIVQRQERPVLAAQADDEAGAARGVIICAEGAENLAVYCRIQQAVAAALDLTADRIEIYPMKKDQKEARKYAE